MISRVRKALGAAAIAALGFTALTGAQAPQGRATRPPVVQPPPPAQAAGRGGSSITWDFETGNLSGWTATGNAFVNQPTLGDNPAQRGSGSANPQGKYWIGTFEFYTGARGKPGASQGDRPTGTLTSAVFNIPSSLAFLIGGGSSKSTCVELLAYEQIDGVFIPVQSASGKDSDTMFDVRWNLSPWAGRPGRIRIVDEATGPWGHINVDYFRFGASVRPGTDTSTPPDLGRGRPGDVTTPTRTPTPTSTPEQPRPAIVPNLYGLTEDEAMKALVAAGLGAGRVDRFENNSAANRVYKQDYAPNTQVRPGTRVGFVIAIPPRPSPTYTPQPPQPAIVPNLYGLTEDEAMKALVAAGLGTGRVDRFENNSPANRVYKQDYAPGSQVRPGTRVGFVIAIPPRPIPTFTPQPTQPRVAFVPDLSGLTEQEAMKSLVAAGLVAGQVDRVESSSTADRVFKQDHAAGSQVSPGTKVGFVIAIPIVAIVPDLVGASDATARALLEKAGLKPGKVSSQQSRARRGEVIAQVIAPGSKVVPGTEVDFSVATPILVNVPNVVRMSWSDAAVTLKKAELLDRVEREESREPSGTVLRQDPAGGAVVEIGRTVNLVVATPVTVIVPQLVGQTADAAAGELKRLELTHGPPRTRETRDAKPGSVIEQSVPPGRRVEIGATVDFVTARLVTVEVPQLIGRSRSDASALIQKSELIADDGGSEESRRPPGTVISQKPAPGTRLDIGSSVSFVTAVPVTVLMPDLGGKPTAEARQLLVAAQLDVGEVTTAEARVPSGSVLKQSIAAGTRVTIGTTVNLVTATPVTVLAPSLLGRTEAEARKALTALELVVGNIRYEESPAAAGTVQTQGIAAGTRTAIGTAVDFVVAVVETTLMPRVTGLTIEAARQALVANRLTAGTEELRESKTDARGTVVAQPFAPDSRVPVGTAIVLTVATPAIVSVPSLDGRTHDEAIAAIREADLTPGGVNFAISWRWRPGGTVIDQDRRPGDRVEFGSTVSVTEAYSRAWLAGGVPIFGLAVFGVGRLAQRLRHRRTRGRPRDDPEDVLVLDITAEPHLDPGEATIRSAESEAIRSEIRVMPVIDAGTQTVASSGDIVVGERRGKDSGATPPEGSS